MTESNDEELFDRDHIARSYHAARERLGANPGARHPLIRAKVRIVKGMLKEARTGAFTFLSDEPAEMGGGDTAPYPLQYLVAAVGF
jgi:hypothetical protein